MEDNNEKIAVIIPCYNHAKYLSQSIKSIQGQSYKNLEIILVNDGSSDDTHDIMSGAAEADNRVRYIRIPSNTGKWNCLNMAIKMCDSNIITCHDADDVALKDRIFRQYQCLKETGTFHNLCGFYHCWNEDDVAAHANKTIVGEIDYMGPQEVLELVSAGFATQGVNHYYTGEFETAGVSAMFYKDIWLLGIRFNPPGAGLRVLNSEDSDFNFRVTAFVRNTSVLKEKLYCYRRETSTNNEMV